MINLNFGSKIGSIPVLARDWAFPSVWRIYSFFESGNFFAVTPRGYPYTVFYRIYASLREGCRRSRMIEWIPVVVTGAFARS